MWLLRLWTVESQTGSTFFAALLWGPDIASHYHKQFLGREMCRRMATWGKNDRFTTPHIHFAQKKSHLLLEGDERDKCDEDGTRRILVPWLRWSERSM